MQVTFTRTGTRRYSVHVDREEAARLKVDPAPGYDEHLPHDLVHFVVEVECGLRDGIYGQLAAGGNAGLFRPVDEHHTKKWKRRNSRKDSLSGKDIPRSEELASVSLVEWYAHTGRAEPKAEHQKWVERAELGPTERHRVVERLDTVAAQWRELGLDESLTFDWPWPERRPHRRRSPRETPAQDGQRGDCSTMTRASNAMRQSSPSA